VVFSISRQKAAGRDERDGRPKSTQTEINITAVDLVKNDHRIASRMIAESLNITKAVVL
jgi:hypothetical protein